MKKLISVCLALIVMASLAACGGADPLKKFLGEAEGNWYLHGDSRSEMLRISADGSYEKFAALEDDEDFGTQNLIESGTISYDKEDKIMSFDIKKDEGVTHYPCTGISDGVLGHYSGNYYPAEISGDLREKFVGKFYADGDTSKDYYAFENGEWKFFQTDEPGVGFSTDGGALEYHGGDRQELYMVEDNMDNDIFATMAIVSETELKDKASGISYVLVDNEGDADN